MAIEGCINMAMKCKFWFDDKEITGMIKTRCSTLVEIEADDGNVYLVDYHVVKELPEWTVIDQIKELIPKAQKRSQQYGTTDALATLLNDLTYLVQNNG